jgi:RNA polymerase sigma factor (sigma-70 family)
MEAMPGDAARVPIDGTPRVGLRLFGDDRLARLAAEGDARALAAIYRRHHQDLYRYCRAILRDPDEAEDALQATMVKVVSSLPGETRSIALKPWLFRVAHNEAITILRARRPAAALDSEQPALGPDVEREAEDRERLRQLVRDLDRLPERQRGALVMRELNGLDFEELGDALGMGPDAAKQAVYEARVSLQEMAAGRDMDCDAVREAISAHDRRTLRSRRIRAHMRDCEGCADFAAAIDARRKDLAALAPPIALPAALAALHAAVGGGSAGTAAVGAAGGAGSIGAGLGGTLGGTAALKTAAAVIAATAIAGGAAGVTGVLHPGGSGDHSADRGGAATAPAPGAMHTDGPGATGASRSEGAATGNEAAGAADSSRAHHPGAASAEHGHRGGSPAQGTSGDPPAHSAAAPTPPGQAQSSPGEASSIAGGDGKAQAVNGKPTTTQSVAHSNLQAQTQSSSAIHSQSTATSHGGGRTQAAEQTTTTTQAQSPISANSSTDGE